jgi:endoglucanase
MSVARKIKKNDDNFQFQRAILDGGTCEASLFYTFGYKTSGLALPLGCYHNNGEDGNVASENIHLHDWFNMIELIWSSVRKTELLIGWKETAQASFINKFSKFRNQL